MGEGGEERREYCYKHDAALNYCINTQREKEKERSERGKERAREREREREQESSLSSVGEEGAAPPFTTPGTTVPATFTWPSGFLDDRSTPASTEVFFQ